MTRWQCLCYHAPEQHREDGCEMYKCPCTVKPSGMTEEEAALKERFAHAQAESTWVPRRDG